ncbi:MAG: RNA polymerase sporulation sigma factor SigH [candidate division WS1 bacterium]|jgi:RNA polymerase sporulation-specific sigma factor|nr:RNA polymerase sporulation sigma factor SigH [candidate division WS1 bacterium]
MVSAAELIREADPFQNPTVLDMVSDEELVRRAQDDGDREACEYLLNKYKNLVKAKVKSYFLVGAEREDLIQIGMIGLWEAISDFRADRHTSFACFAKVCIQRQMISAIKAATRQKQAPLNSSVSLEAPPNGEDDEDSSLLEIVAAHAEADPETLVMGIEGERILQQSLREQLSPFEWQVLTEYRLGKSYKEMATGLTCKIKSIDNALSRIRRKLPQVMPYLAQSGLYAEPTQ